jgi:hypothetical protein
MANQTREINYLFIVNVTQIDALTKSVLYPLTILYRNQREKRAVVQFMKLRTKFRCPFDVDMPMCVYCARRSLEISLHYLLMPPKKKRERKIEFQPFSARGLARQNAMSGRGGGEASVLSIFRHRNECV